MSLAMTAAGESSERWKPSSGAPCGEEGAPEGDSNNLEQASPLDDVSDAECALAGPLGFQLVSESRRRIGAGAGVVARHAALDAPFKPPRA